MQLGEGVAQGRTADYGEEERMGHPPVDAQSGAFGEKGTDKDVEVLMRS